MPDLRDMTHNRQDPLFDGAPEAPTEQPMMVYESGVPAPTAMVPVTSPVFAILERAIEHGTDPANLERLVALVERMQAKEAENKFNAAMQRFQSLCPVILKNRSGFKDAYTFADLPQITQTIRGALDACGLSYSFDSETTDKSLKTICTVHHIAGHKRTATFQCLIDGTTMMSSQQKSAATLTYCRRYALVLALGLTTADEDHDAMPPEKHDNPEQAPCAPQAATRAERKQPPVTQQQITEIIAEWKTRRKDHEATPENFQAWFSKVTGIQKDVRKPSSWSPVALELCQESLQKELG